MYIYEIIIDVRKIFIAYKFFFMFYILRRLTILGNHIG